MYKQPQQDRRSFLVDQLTKITGMSLGTLAAMDLLVRDQILAQSNDKTPISPVIDPANPNKARGSHFEPKAKQVLMIFCAGACSHLDTFDYKPSLIENHDRPMPGSEKLITFQGGQGTLQKSPWEFRPRGQSGKMISDLVGNIGDLHSWLILELKHKPKNEDNFTLTPFIRFFKGDVLTEIGADEDGKVLFNLIYRF